MNHILPNIDKINNEKISKKLTILIMKIYEKENLDDEELIYILDNITGKELRLLQFYADRKRKEIYGKYVYMRGLIEFSNICKQNCKYCGIRGGNLKVERYRLSKDEILDSVNSGLQLGFNTFVLQSGEDNYFTDDVLIDMIKSIRKLSNECAITLSIGERSKESYQALYNAGANRYLLRHETASKSLYDNLHPQMSFENRRKCLYELKEIGYQIGAGMMIGLPNQTNGDLLLDLKFLKELNPHMCGIGPYICHSDTPLKGAINGTVNQTLVLVALIRLLLPKVLLPATTALGTIDKLGREKALKGGANVVMPNLTPNMYREKYELYQNKICINDDAIKCRSCIDMKINLSGYLVDMSRGDHIDFNNK